MRDDKVKRKKKKRWAYIEIHKIIGKREHGPDELLKALMSTFSKAPSGPSSTSLSNKSLQATKSEKKKCHQSPKMSPSIVMCMPLHNYMLIN